jgi:RND superfamily putative drug exporter
MLTSVARFCVRRRRGVLAAWMLLFVAGIAAASMLFMRLTDSNGGASSESARGSALLTKASSMGPMAVVLVKGPALDSPGTRAAVQALTARLERVPQVTGAVNAYTSTDSALRATDGHASLIVVTVRKDAGMMDKQMAVNAMRSAARGAVPGAQVQVGGDLGQMKDGMAAIQNDLIRGNEIALPILLVALVFIFGGLRAALLPVFGALAAASGTLLVLLGVTYVTNVAPYAVDVVMLLGLGLAVDYSLLMVNRFREARATGLTVAGAVERTAATAGRTVTFSALTVATSLSGLFVFGDPTFTSVALAGIATVLFTLAVALTLIPALLGAVGGKLSAARRENASDGFFGLGAGHRVHLRVRPVHGLRGVPAVQDQGSLRGVR